MRVAKVDIFKALQNVPLLVLGLSVYTNTIAVLNTTASQYRSNIRLLIIVTYYRSMLRALM